LKNISGNHDATWQQKLADDLSSVVTMFQRKAKMRERRK